RRISLLSMRPSGVDEAKSHFSSLLQEIRLEDNGQAELILRNGLTVPVSRRYLKSLKEAIGL
ncbi:LytTR family transcriptional regulator DNA-binding domain-containing protein, partial [Escherichia sp. SS-MK2]